jgi:hypothetical protein
MFFFQFQGSLAWALLIWPAPGNKKFERINALDNHLPASQLVPAAINICELL